MVIEKPGRQNKVKFSELRSQSWRKRSSPWAMVKYVAILILVIWGIYLLRGLF